VRSAASTKEGIDDEGDSKDGEGGEPVERHSFDGSRRRRVSGRTVTTSMIRNGESVTARHTRFERHLKNATAVNGITYWYLGFVGLPFVSGKVLRGFEIGTGKSRAREKFEG